MLNRVFALFFDLIAPAAPAGTAGAALPIRGQAAGAGTALAGGDVLVVPGPKAGAGADGRLVVRAATAAPAANLQEWQSNGGSAVAWVTPAGVFHGDGSGLTNLPAPVLPATVAYTDRSNTFQSEQAVLALGPGPAVLTVGGVQPAGAGNVLLACQAQGTDVCTVNDAGTVTAVAFAGDGSQLTNLPVTTATAAHWNYSTSTVMADPGSGKVRANAASPPLTSQLAISALTAGNNDLSQTLASLLPGDTVYVQDQNDSTKWARYSISMAISNNTTWFAIPVAVVGTAGGSVNNNETLLIQFEHGVANVARTDQANTFTVGPQWVQADAGSPGWLLRASHTGAAAANIFGVASTAGNLFTVASLASGAANVTVGTPAGGSTLTVTGMSTLRTVVANNRPLVVQGASGQTSDLTQWVNNAGTPLAYVTALGVFSGNGSALTNLTAGNLTGTVPVGALPAAVVLTTGGYADPAWITSLAYAKITGAPTGMALLASANTFTAGPQTVSVNAASLQNLLRLNNADAGGGGGQIQFTQGATIVGTVAANFDGSGWALRFGPYQLPNTFILRNNAGFPRLSLGPSDLTGVYAATFGVQAAQAGESGLVIRAFTGQTADLQQWLGPTGVVLSTVSENGYFTTRKTAAPADAELQAGELALWLDATPGGTKLMIKAKDSGGTVRAGSLALV